jgi:hypothetical protein
MVSVARRDRVKTGAADGWGRPRTLDPGLRARRCDSRAWQAEMWSPRRESGTEIHCGEWMCG